jgi:hypothetical protein
VDDGIDAAIVARHVFDAVRIGRLYILTHPQENASIELRLQDILQGRASSELETPRTQTQT